MKVYGDKICAVPLTIGKSMVYVRTNIEECVTEEDLACGVYERNEKLYTKDNLILRMDNMDKILSI